MTSSQTSQPLDQSLQSSYECRCTNYELDSALENMKSVEQQLKMVEHLLFPNTKNRRSSALGGGRSEGEYLRELERINQELRGFMPIFPPVQTAFNALSTMHSPHASALDEAGRDQVAVSPSGQSAHCWTSLLYPPPDNSIRPGPALLGLLPQTCVASVCSAPLGTGVEANCSADSLKPNTIEPGVGNTPSDATVLELPPFTLAAYSFEEHDFERKGSLNQLSDDGEYY